MAKSSTPPPSSPREPTASPTTGGEGTAPRRPRRIRRKGAASGEGEPRTAVPDRMEWADPLSEEERRALEAAWGFIE